MLFTDEDLFGAPAVQGDIFEAIAEVESAAASVSMGNRYGCESGVIDLFGFGQLSIAGV